MGPMNDLRDLEQLAARNGLNLFGVVDAARFDRGQPAELRSAALAPGCGSILVLGTGGNRPCHEFGRQVGADVRAVDAPTADMIAEASVRVIAHELGRLGVRARQVGPAEGRLPFATLGEAAGFGVVSPISGMLLHPEFGPWLRVRAALLLEGQPFGAVAATKLPSNFMPCCGCSQPCVSSCPPGAIAAEGSGDRRRCADYRFSGGCADACRARQACPVGAEHADVPGRPRHAHSLGEAALRQRFGKGWRQRFARALRGPVRAR